MLKVKRLLFTALLSILFVFLFAAFAYAEGNQTGIVNCEVLNVRQNPDSSSKILVQLPKGTSITLLDSSDGWYKVKDDGITGWVSSQFVTVKDTSKAPAKAADSTAADNSDAAVKTGVVTVSVVNVRSSADSSSSVLIKLSEGAKVTVLGKSGDWYQVKTASNITGWIYAQYLAVRDSDTASRAYEEPAPAVTAPKDDDSAAKTKGEEIVEYAKKFLGTKYVWGGSSPKGFDCSGFAQYVYAHFGITLNRVAADQAKQGKDVAFADLKAGDLVFFDTNHPSKHTYVNHVGIYIGNGQFIEASSSRSVRRVVITTLNSGFYSKAFMKAKRFVD